MTEADQPLIPVTPLDASTVLLIRDSDDGIEVFMVVRHSKADFASGALVFPGGKVDPDADADTLASWQRAIDAIAACPNAVMKAGGVQKRVGPWEPPFHMRKRPTPISSEELCQ